MKTTEPLLVTPTITTKAFTFLQPALPTYTVQTNKETPQEPAKANFGDLNNQTYQSQIYNLLPATFTQGQEQPTLSD